MLHPVVCMLHLNLNAAGTCRCGARCWALLVGSNWLSPCARQAQPQLESVQQANPTESVQQANPTVWRE